MKPATVYLRKIISIALGLGLGGSAWGQQATASISETAPATPPATTSNAPVPPAAASTPADPMAGIIPELHVGDKVYYNVQVREVTPLTIIFSHRQGIASAALKDLSPELQKRFGYDTDKAAQEAAREEEDAQSRRVQIGLSPGDKAPPTLATQAILQRFGQPPKIFQEVSMRERFEKLGIGAKNQGARPSCAIFAMVSALEYQQAPRDGPAPEFSEEYLIWSTLKTLGKSDLNLPKEPIPGYDVGFSLTEVCSALRGYGIALEEEVPYHLTSSDPHAIEISPDIIASAQKRGPFNGFYITGREPATQIANIVQVINAGVPVVVGMKWPDEQTLQETALLDAQPGREHYEHAILLIGYRTEKGTIEDTQFLFKNSYGDKWGDHGYGVVTYRYLLNNLGAAMFLDVK